MQGVVGLFTCISTHTHTRLTALCPGPPRWAGTRKEKPIWILLKQETVRGSGIHWAICKSASRFSQITMPAPHHSVFYRPGALPAAQPTVSKHWRHECIDYPLTANLPRNLPVKQILKSVKIWQNYGHESVASVFLAHPVHFTRSVVCVSLLSGTRVDGRLYRFRFVDPRNPVLDEGCTLASPGEFDWNIHGGNASLSGYFDYLFCYCIHLYFLVVVTSCRY